MNRKIYSSCINVKLCKLKMELICYLVATLDDRLDKNVSNITGICLYKKHGNKLY